MKMIYLISRARRCGPVNQALNILTGMKLNGSVESMLVTISPELEDNSWLERFKDNGIDVFSLDSPIKKTLCSIPKLKRFLKENNIDIIHSSGFRANLISALMPKKYIKISTQRCSPYYIAEKLPSILQPFIRSIYLKIIRRLNKNVACSEALADIFDKEYGMKIPYVQNGVNTDFFKPIKSPDKEDLCKKLNLDPNKRKYLILGSFQPRKNNSMAVRVFNKFTDKNAQFIFVGSGPELENLKLESTNQNTIFIGRTDNPIHYLQTADILISCSLSEGLPNSVLEAMSCGLPCILSDIEPHRELIEDLGIGLLFNVNNDIELEKAIIESLDWNINDMCAKAREIALTHFDRKIIAKNYEDIYKSI